MTNGANIYDIVTIYTEMEILLNQCDDKNLTDIFEISELSKSILPWDN